MSCLFDFQFFPLLVLHTCKKSAGNCCKNNYYNIVIFYLSQFSVMCLAWAMLLVAFLLRQGLSKECNVCKFCEVLLLV